MVILLKANTFKKQWLITKITDVHKGNDCHVRTIKHFFRDNRFIENCSIYLVHPIYKMFC